MRGTHRHPRQLRFLAVSGLLLLSACGIDVGVAEPKDRTDVIIGGDPVTTTASTAPATTLPPPDVPIKGDEGAEVNRVAANAIADLQAYWTKTYPQVFGQPYQPIGGGFFAADRNDNVSELPCRPPSIQVVMNNAYYCPQDDAITWDQENLMPSLAAQYGDFVVAVVLAHEWGHAIQARAGTEFPTVVLELQADCYAGAWSKHITTDADARFKIDVGDIDSALAGVLSLRDAPGTESSDPNAHGSGFDRVGAFQEGYVKGAGRCKDFKPGDPQPFQFPFSAQEDQSGGDLYLDGADGINALTFKSLDAYWADTYPSISGGKPWKTMKAPVAFEPDAPPSCNGRTVTTYRLFLCVPERYVAYDEKETIPQAYELGDFAVATLYATQYGLEVQHDLGKDPADEVVATLRGDCYAGAWARALLPGNTKDAYQLTLSGGDLDEAMAVLLTFRTQSDRDRQGPGFGRARAFRIGVTEGVKPCVGLTAG